MRGKKPEKVEVVKLVTFALGADLFAAEVFAVERALRYVQPNNVPDLPEWIAGVIEYESRVIPAVDMRRRMGLPSTEITHETRTLVFVAQENRIAAIVDEVHEVATVPKASINPPPAMFRGLAAEFVRGIVKVHEQLVVILDAERVLTSCDLIALERALESRDGASARG
ncbi:MAG TPA: chemotaxis protein CheW [Gemmatimonadaceae bacterium]|jgi:purine-binding chemotaxis protein CheW